MTVDVPESAGRLSKAQATAGKKISDLVTRVVESGVGPVTGSASYATERLARARTTAATVEEAVEAAIRRIIRESVAAAGTAGFLTGFGGLVTMPVTVPTNMAGALVINARMVGAIAHLRGYALDDPHTRAMIPLVVAGSSAQGFASELGVKLGQAATKQAIKAIPMSVIHRVNARAGIYLVAKYGAQRSAITLAKAVPFVGGVVGGGVDATLTRAVGALAKRAFPA